MMLSKEEKQKVRKALIRKFSVQKLQTPLEYHYFAWHWNWDNGIKPLEWIIQQPNCDKGTALLIYWYASPTWYCQYQDRKSVRASGGNVKHYDLIKGIEKRIAEDFYTTQTICFSPRDDSGYDWTTENADKPVIAPIPTVMLQASLGVELKKNVLSGFVQRDLTTEETEQVRREIASGLNALRATSPEVREESDPDAIVAAIQDYVDVERETVGRLAKFNGPQAKVGWVLTRQIERKYGWKWQVCSVDDGDTERTALMSPDNVLMIAPPNSVVLAIKRQDSGEKIGKFFDLLGTYERTQDFGLFYALNWIGLVRR